MILQALNDYYLRKQAADAGALAPEGFEYKEIPFVIVLRPDGSVLALRDTREGEGKARRAKRYTVPKAPKKSVNIASSLLWANAEYALGLLCKDRIKKRAKLVGKKLDNDVKRLAEQHEAFKQRLQADLAGCEDAGLKALDTFLQSPSFAALDAFPAFAEVRASNPNVSFQLSGDAGLIAERPAVVAHLQQAGAQQAATAEASMRCLVTGEADDLARLHDSIKGVWGANTSGANIVSFNLAAFNSWGKAQGGNAPIGKKAASNYAAALNLLLGKDSKQRVQVGDASTVFWASKAETAVESAFSFLAGAKSDDPDAGARAVKSLYAAIHNGAYIAGDGNERFHVLGLSPNAARLSVRFWYAAPIREFGQHIANWFADAEVALPAYEGRSFLPLFALLKSLAVQGKSENIPPNIAGDTLRAIVTGQPLPATLLNMAVIRCRAERTVSPARASLIKACLTRQARLTSQPEHTLTMSLNPDDLRPAYRLGRLFAALERIQYDALGDVGSNVCDRYYGAASASPAAIFGVLLKNVKNHLEKLRKTKPGLEINRQKLLREISKGLSDMPTQMSLSQQALFGLAYYHQMQAFWESKSDPDSDDESTIQPN
jgi:CRISPR-associated protein Csd1